MDIELGSVEAYRRWVMGYYKGLPVLLPMAYESKAWPYGVVEATCTISNHNAPDRSCTCGIYAIKNLSDIGKDDFPVFASFISGKIQLFGKTIVHEYGYRGQFAKIVHLYRSTECGICSSPVEIGENGTVGLIYLSVPHLEVVNEVYCKECTTNAIEDSKDENRPLVDIFVYSKTFEEVDISKWRVISSSQLRALYDSLVELYITE